MDSMAGWVVFSSLDLLKSYHQVPVAEKDMEKTALLTPLGSFAFKRAAMDLRNSGAVSQRFMDDVTRGLDFMYVYIDDVLVFSRSTREYLEHLTQLLECLQFYGLVINEDKCHFSADKISFLGYTESRQGIRSRETRIEVIRNFSLPPTYEELKRYLGMLNFYRRHIPKAAEVLIPLHKFTSTKRGRISLFAWDDEVEVGFVKSKVLLVDSALLEYPPKGAHAALSVDASGVAVAGALHQGVDGGLRPIAFFSKALSPTEVRHFTFDRKLLAMYLSVKHFRYFLEGRSFCIYSDQRPLVSAFLSTFKDGSARQTRHMSFITEFTTDIRHINGTENVVDDCLSRPNLNSIFDSRPTLDFEAMSEVQKSDPWIQQVEGPGQSSLQVVSVDIPGSEKKLMVVNGNFSWQLQIFSYRSFSQASV